MENYLTRFGSQAVGKWKNDNQLCGPLIRKSFHMDSRPKRLDHQLVQWLPSNVNQTWLIWSILGQPGSCEFKASKVAGTPLVDHRSRPVLQY